MQAVFVDVWNEVIDVRREAAHLAVALDRQGSKITINDQELWEQTHIRASAIEKIYTGCERIMAKLATDLDNTPVAHADGWHIALLQRMANPFPAVRTAVISRATYKRLDRLRAFRHRTRNSYGIDLDPTIVLDRAHEAVQTFDHFQDEVQHFLFELNFDISEVETVRSRQG